MLKNNASYIQRLSQLIGHGFSQQRRTELFRAFQARRGLDRIGAGVMTGHQAGVQRLAPFGRGGEQPLRKLFTFEEFEKDALFFRRHGLKCLIICG